MKVIIASRNKKKIKELGAILQDMDIGWITQDEAGIFESAVEDGGTFEENAIKKARFVMHASRMAAVADDSGLEVFALGCAPGVFSARYAPGSDDDRVNKLLYEMKDIKKEQRGAQFVCCIAFSSPDGMEFVARGECRGEIIGQKLGRSGFGYDPVFYVPAYRMTFSQMDEDIKNRISHRAKALCEFGRILQDKIAKDRE